MTPTAGKNCYRCARNGPTVTRYGRICFKGRKVNLGDVFAGQNVGIKEISERIRLVSFMQYDLGYIDRETFDWKTPAYILETSDSTTH